MITLITVYIYAKRNVDADAVFMLAFILDILIIALTADIIIKLIS